MTTTTKIQAQKISTSVKLFVAVVLMVLSNNGVFGQNKAVALTNTTATEVSVSKNLTIEISADSAVASSSMDFAVWFMGTVKTTNDSKSNNGTYSKKQLINSGITTNSVLIRSFLKKVINQENNIA